MWFEEEFLAWEILVFPKYKVDPSFSLESKSPAFKKKKKYGPK